LVGMYGNFHTLEISMEILQKTENGTTLWSSYTLRGI
jgi:hypothetical protein